ncbi:hypothetical protein [Modestobacter sp. Leaf380]|uniref:hypothetical protein n=1 Tax=Modestobacter sp. Leaf380 TaxID=1736356 RepID=UPI0006FAB9C9|nr:hypothetical protein [Modestobacter sp. Leaf380]KQS73642.1 hypothetical protein ASG41_03235 [Modestobacter sp. Leaf380]
MTSYRLAVPSRVFIGCVALVVVVGAPLLLAGRIDLGPEMRDPVGTSVVSIGSCAIAARLWMLRVTVDANTIEIVNFFSTSRVLKHDVVAFRRASSLLDASGELSLLASDGRVIPLQVAAGAAPLYESRRVSEMERDLNVWLTRR